MSMINSIEVNHLVNLSTLNYIPKINDNIIKKCVNLKELDLSAYDTDEGCLLPNVSDNGIKNLINIEDLNLCNNHIITDEGIKNLINLKKLNLCNNNNITENGIKHLVNLEELNLFQNTNITEKYIKSSSSLKKIKINKYNKLNNDECIKYLKNKGIDIICIF